MNQLTEQEIELLFEALDAWEKRDGVNNVMTTIVGKMLIPEDKQPEWELEQKRKEQEAERQKRLDAQRVVLLKAKLIGIGNAIEASAVAEEMKS